MCVCVLFPGNPALDFQTLDLVVVETEKLHIPVPFRAVPSPRVTWHKDGKELKADDRLSFRSLFLPSDVVYKLSFTFENIFLENKFPVLNKFVSADYLIILCPNLSHRKEYTSCHLEVDSSLHADAGQYKVTLENKLGAASGTINVKVIGKELQLHMH